MKKYISELLKLSDSLDKKGLYAEANLVDNIIKGISQSKTEPIDSGTSIEIENLENALKEEIEKRQALEKRFLEFREDCMEMINSILLYSDIPLETLQDQNLRTKKYHPKLKSILDKE